MIIMYVLMFLWLIFAIVLLKSDRLKEKKGLAYLVIFGPLVPFLAIQSGWMVAEIGRQPWVVYGLLQTNDALSMSVSAPEVLITIALFIVFYAFLFVVWLRLVLRMIKKGPVLEVAGDASAELAHPESKVAAVTSKDTVDVDTNTKDGE